MKRFYKLLSVLLMFVVFAGTLKVSANSELIESLDSASIRDEGEQGLRFYAKVLDAEAIEEKGFYLVYGKATISELEAAIDAASGTITLNGKEVFKVVVPGARVDDTFSVVLTGIPEEGYFDEITVIAYAKGLGSDLLTFAESVVRSVAEVAIRMDEDDINPPEDILTFFENVRRVRLDNDQLEISKGLKDYLGDYVETNLYDIYFSDVTSIILPEPTEKPGYQFKGYKLGSSIYDVGEVFTFTEVDVLFSLEWEQITADKTYTENFNAVSGNVSGYGTEDSFTDANGFAWSLKGRNDQTLNGAAWTLGNKADGSFVEVKATGGISSFSLDVVKGFSNSNPRELELFVNNVSYGTFSVNTTSEVSQKWAVNEINVSGDVTIKVTSINTGNRGATIIDNFSWENFGIITDADKVFAAKENLAIDFSGSDTLSNVKGNVSLLSKGLYNTNITWTSSDNDTINPLTGVVNRPIGEVSLEVILTATISLDGYELSTTKEFNLTVISLIEYTVSFDLGFSGGTPPSSQVVENGDLANKPTDPTRTDFIFGGWTEDGEKFNFNTPITKDTTLTASWLSEDDFVTVIFNSNGGTSIESQTILKGEQASKPANPTKANHSFGGWYSDSSLNTSFDFNDYLTISLTLYAKWNEQALTPYYASVENKTGQALLTGLRSIISSYKDRGYDAAKSVLQVSDRDPNNANNILLVYDRSSIIKTWGGNPLRWNREHVWPQSKLGSASKSNIHNLKPSDVDINSSRGNYPFVNGSGSYGRVGSGWYPGNEDKGDIARIIFYMVTHYSHLSINTMGSLPVLIQWHNDDPVDAFEVNRNNVIYSEQNNRNPFIDYPEFVDLIWGNQTASNPVSFVGQYNAIVNTLTYTNEQSVLANYKKLSTEYLKNDLELV